MSKSQSPAQAPPQAPSPQPQPQHEQSQLLYPYSSDTIIATARPASPFFRHRPLGRAPSPPTWACYEQIPARSELLGSSDESDSDSGDEAADEDSLSDADCNANPADDPDDADADDNSSLSDDDDDDAEAAGLMDVEDDEDGSGRDGGDPEKRDKGKQRAEVPRATTGDDKSSSSPVIPHAPPPPRHRRPRSRRPPMSALRPILTIQRSQGFVWNQVRALSSRVRASQVFIISPLQDLFVPPYIKDRCAYSQKLFCVADLRLYFFLLLDVASTSPPSSMGVFSTCGSTSTSLGDYEIEVVEIRVRDGELDDIIP
jgi:hypothetical protein